MGRGETTFFEIAFLEDVRKGTVKRLLEKQTPWNVVLLEKTTIVRAANKFHAL
jgi:hypothetical protein